MEKGTRRGSEGERKNANANINEREVTSMTEEKKKKKPAKKKREEEEY